MIESEQARPITAETIGIIIAVAVPKAKSRMTIAAAMPDRVADPGVGLGELLADVGADGGLEAGRARPARPRRGPLAPALRSSSPGPTPRTTGM